MGTYGGQKVAGTKSRCGGQKILHFYQRIQNQRPNSALCKTYILESYP